MAKRTAIIFAVTLLSLAMCGCDSLEKMRMVARRERAFIRAVQMNDIDRVRTHLAEGVNVNAVDSRGRTAAKIAQCEGHGEIAALLLANGGKAKVYRPGGT